MRPAAILLAVVFGLVCRTAFGQGAGEPVAHLGVCSPTEDAARPACLDDPSRRLAQSERPTLPGNDWLVSETTSPVDYSPIVIATTLSRETSDKSSIQLSIYCRGGRTELVVAGPAILHSAKEYAIAYRINDDPPVQTAAATPSFGTGAAFRGDVVRLLQLLPEEGEIVIRLSPRTGAVQEGRFSLGGLRSVREKLATACKWPRAIARPHN
jgi:hypothetical protein